MQRFKNAVRSKIRWAPTQIGSVLEWVFDYVALPEGLA
jgi:hypothetical protein